MLDNCDSFSKIECIGLIECNVVELYLFGGAFMYRVFNLDWRNEAEDVKASLDKKISGGCLLKDDQYYKNLYNTDHQGLSSQIYDYIVKKINGKTLLDGDRIQQECFGIKSADIFLSHSHADEYLALRIKKLLETKYNLNVFIDSCVWAYCDDILMEIDKEYCLNEDGEYFDYKKRNGTTSMIHMMLANALTTMMDQTECIFFLNTEKSNFSNACTDEATTGSPWIYHELSTANILRKKKPDRKDTLKKFASVTESVEMQHTVDLNGFTKLDFYNFNKWLDSTICNKIHPLDKLYDMYPAAK